MDNNLKDKIAKIQELILRGATEGERAAAKKALERILKSHNIDESQLTSILFKEYVFKFSTKLELRLLGTLMYLFLEKGVSCAEQTHLKRVTAQLMYEQWVSIECSYEYFRRHMKKQYKKHVQPELNRCRKAKTRREMKEILEPVFFNNYCIASKLYKDQDILKISVDEMNKEKVKAHLQLSGIEGGHYNKQVISNQLLSY